MTKEQKIIRAKVGLLELAKQLSNVSLSISNEWGPQVCQEPSWNENLIPKKIQAINRRRRI